MPWHSLIYAYRLIYLFVGIHGARVHTILIHSFITKKLVFIRKCLFTGIWGVLRAKGSFVIILFSFLYLHRACNLTSAHAYTHFVDSPSGFFECSKKIFPPPFFFVLLPDSYFSLDSWFLGGFCYIYTFICPSYYFDIYFTPPLASPLLVPFLTPLSLFLC